MINMIQSKANFTKAMNMMMKTISSTEEKEPTTRSFSDWRSPTDSLVRSPTGLPRRRALASLAVEIRLDDSGDASVPVPDSQTATTFPKRANAA
jgi:hypothetical protein